MRVNWLAIIVSAFALFLFGYLWYDQAFGQAWMAQMAPFHAQMPSGGTWYPFVVSLVAGFFSAYGLARILAWRGYPSIGTGAFIGLSMGLLLFGTMTWMDYAYSGFGATLGWINIGYVAIGYAIQGAILAAWKPKAA